MITIADKKITVPHKTEKLPNNNLENTIIYTIQLGAFKKEPATDNQFFTKFNNNIVKILGNDGLYKYTYGSYTNRKVAEDHALIMHKMGYKNAFVIEK